MSEISDVTTVEYILELDRCRRELANNLIERGAEVNVNDPINELVPKVKQVGYDANWKALAEGTLVNVDDNTIENLTDYAFYNNQNIKIAIFRKAKIANNYTFGSSQIESIECPNLEICSNYVFYNCSKLEKVIAPNLKTISQWCFASCASLKELYLPKLISASATSIYNLSILERLNLPSFLNVTSSNQIYNLSSLKIIDLGSVQSITNNAFQNCYNLETLIIRSTEMCTLGGATLAANSLIANGTGYIYVPKALIDDYKTATNWVAFADQFRAIEDYPDITALPENYWGLEEETE